MNEEKKKMTPHKMGKTSRGKHKLARLSRHCRRLLKKEERWARYRKAGRHEEVRTKKVRQEVDEGEMLVDEDGVETWKPCVRSRMVTVTRRKTWNGDRLLAEVKSLERLLASRRAAVR